MLLSFSMDEMRPMIEAGVAEKHGPAGGFGRTKCQTIRKFDGNPRSPYARVKPGDALHLWWKSRTAARKRLGLIDCLSVSPITIYSEAPWGKRGVILGDPKTGPCLSDEAVVALAYADGFTNADAFYEFFVADAPIAFRGVLIKW
ncbi:MAG: hypothetical protein COA69_13520 [Robiginitomaculum sp.]|nr:MAG: hypothetical protein COA69_13520 [Robiginitomaculum sp.]